MYIHLGEDVIVSARDVVAILDARNAARSDAMRAFVAGMRRSGDVMEIDPLHCKSYVVTDAVLYISPISSNTLKKRAQARQFALHDA